MSVKNSGFPSPAEEYKENILSLDKHLIKTPSATFFMEADSEVMAPHIQKHDVLVVDRSLTPENGSLIVAHCDGDFLVRRLEIKNNQRTLLSEKAAPFLITEDADFTIFGVVTWVIHKTF